MSFGQQCSAVQCRRLTYRYLSCPDRWSLDMPKQPHMRETREPFASLSLALMRGGPPALACSLALAGAHKRSVATAQVSLLSSKLLQLHR